MRSKQMVVMRCQRNEHIVLAVVAPNYDLYSFIETVMAADREQADIIGIDILFILEKIAQFIREVFI